MKNYVIKQSGDKWQLWTRDGSKLLGTFDSKEEALKRERQIQWWKRQEAIEDDSDEAAIRAFTSDLQTIKDVDIFAVGTWFGKDSGKEGDTYREADLDEMVEAFEAGVVTPKLKITHGDDKDQPEVGEVANLRRVGKKLVGDFVNVPSALYELMKKTGVFSRRSAEVMWGLKDKAGKTWRRALKAVALLAPGQKAAVTALSDGYQFEAVYCYEYQEPEEDENGELLTYEQVMYQGTEHRCRLAEPGKFQQFRRKNAEQKHDGKAIDVIYGITAGGSERKSAIQALAYNPETWKADSAKAHCASRGGKFDAGKPAGEKSHEQGGDKMSEEEKAKLQKQIEELTAARQEDKVKLENYESKQAELRAESRKQFIDSMKKDGKILPKDETRITALFDAVEGIESTHSYELDGKKVEESAVDTLKSFISGLPKLIDLKERSVEDKTKTVDSEKHPAGEVDRLVAEYQTEGKAKDYEEGIKLVRKEHPELWKAYNK